VSGLLTCVACSDTQTWGVNSAGQVYVSTGRAGTDISWKQVEGTLVNISVSMDSVWGVNSVGNIYYGSAKALSELGSSNWVQVAGNLSCISVSGDSVWGVNSSGNVFCGNGPDLVSATGTWTSVPGSLANISVSGNSVWGVDSSGSIWCGNAQDLATGAGVLISVPGSLVQVSVSGDYVWGVNSSTNIFFSNNNTLGIWAPVNGSLTWVAVAAASVRRQEVEEAAAKDLLEREERAAQEKAKEKVGHISPEGDHRNPQGGEENGAVPAKRDPESQIPVPTSEPPNPRAKQKPTWASLEEELKSIVLAAVWSFCIRVAAHLEHQYPKLCRALEVVIRAVSKGQVRSDFKRAVSAVEKDVEQMILKEIPPVLKEVGLQTFEKYTEVSSLLAQLEAQGRMLTDAEHIATSLGLPIAVIAKDTDIFHSVIERCAQDLAIIQRWERRVKMVIKIVHDGEKVMKVGEDLLWVYENGIVAALKVVAEDTMVHFENSKVVQDTAKVVQDTAAVYKKGKELYADFGKAVAEARKICSTILNDVNAVFQKAQAKAEQYQQLVESLKDGNAMCNMSNIMKEKLAVMLETKVEKMGIKYLEGKAVKLLQKKLVPYIQKRVHNRYVRVFGNLAVNRLIKPRLTGQFQASGGAGPNWKGDAKFGLQGGICCAASTFCKDLKDGVDDDVDKASKDADDEADEKGGTEDAGDGDTADVGGDASDAANDVSKTASDITDGVKSDPGSIADGAADTADAAADAGEAAADTAADTAADAGADAAADAAADTAADVATDAAMDAVDASNPIGWCILGLQVGACVGSREADLFKKWGAELGGPFGTCLEWFGDALGFACGAILDVFKSVTDACEWLIMHTPGGKFLVHMVKYFHDKAVDNGGVQYLPQISKYQDQMEQGMVVWGCNSSSDVFVTTNTSGAWRQVSGLLTCVACSDTQTWGVNSAGQVYVSTGRAGTDISWKQVEGTLVNISVSMDSVWGVNSVGNIYYGSAKALSELGSSNWVQVAGNLSCISVSGDSVWGVNSSGNVFCGNGPDLVSATGTWTSVPGSLANISVSGNSVWGVDSSGSIWCGNAQDLATGAGVLISVPGSLVQVSVSGDYVWGVNSSTNIFFSNNNTLGIWTPVNGSLTWVAVAATTAAASNAQCYLRSDWEQLKGTAWDSPTSALAVKYTYNPFPNMFMNALFVFPKIVVAMENGSLEYLDLVCGLRHYHRTGYAWLQLQGTGWGAAVTQMSVKHPDLLCCSPPQIVVGLSNGSVQLLPGDLNPNLNPSLQWSELSQAFPTRGRHGSCPPSAVTAMATLFASQKGVHPQIVVGLACGCVLWYDGQVWTELHSTGWGTYIVHLQASFAQASPPQVVVCLGNGSVQWLPPGAVGWQQLQGDVCGKHTSNYGSATEMAVAWNPTPGGAPSIVVGYTSSTVMFYDGSGWIQLHDSGWDSPVVRLAVEFNASFGGAPLVVVALSDCYVGYFNGSCWYALTPCFDKKQVKNSQGLSCMQVNFTPQGPEIVVGLTNGSVWFASVYDVANFNGNYWQLYAPNNESINHLVCDFRSGHGAYWYPAVVVGLGAYNGKLF